MGAVQRTGTDRRTYPLLLLIICFTMLANIFGWHDDSAVVVKGRWVTECVGRQYNVRGAAMRGDVNERVQKGKKKGEIIIEQITKIASATATYNI